MNQHGHWITLDSLIFLSRLHLAIGDDEPLDLTLRRLFTGILGKLMFYSRCDHGLHLIANAIGTPNDTRLYKLEIAHLYLPKQPASLSLEASDTESLECERFPPYVRYEQSDEASGTGLRQIIWQRLCSETTYKPFLDESDNWERVIQECCEQRRQEMERLKPGISRTDGAELSECDISMPREIMAILLSKVDDNKLPAGRLGVLLLWGNDDLKAIKERLEEKLFQAASCFGQYVEKFLEMHFKIGRSTYLPSYRNPGPRSVAILFADIRDFTPITEIARNFNLLEELRSFISDYCERLCDIIQKNGGRVHNLAGDGIMALFGEYDIPQDAVRHAVTAAEKMCDEFEAIKTHFLNRKEIRNFLRSAYEPMNPRLGIGINFGEVFLDYFGAKGSRQYSPLGDHVNFAQRLESQANRYDESLFNREHERMGRMRAPILLSRPAWIIGGFSPQDKRPDLSIQVKGKPFAYPAYEWPPPRT